VDVEVEVDNGDAAAAAGELRCVRRVAYTDNDGDSARPDDDLVRTLSTTCTQYTNINNLFSFTDLFIHLFIYSCTFR